MGSLTQESGPPSGRLWPVHSIRSRLLSRLRDRSLRSDARSSIELHVIGGFWLTEHERTIAIPASTQRLLALLALRQRPLRRAYVAGILWIDADEDRATASLRSALWRLRRPGFPLVKASGSDVGLGSDVEVDYRDALELAHWVVEGWLDQLGVSLDDVPFHLLTQDLLPDWYEDWVAGEREFFRQLRLHALEILCLRFAKARLFARAVEAGLAAVQAEPLRESAHRALMRAYAAEGNRHEVLRQYHWYRRLLLEELGGSPSAEMEELALSLDAAR